jgi:3-isopropylmalate dehydrogenase
MYKIALITGDGIGPEISEAVTDVLQTVHDKLGLKMEINTVEAGDTALKRTGKALPASTLEIIKKSDACLKAPVGENAADVIIVLRRGLNLYANIRPAKSYPNMPYLNENIDLVIVRENTEDLYAGMEFEVDNTAVALRTVSVDASKRIAKFAFITSKQRNKQRKVTCVHKSNVMRKTDGLFSKSCAEVAKDYPEIAFEQMYVDACAMNLIKQPESFDIIVTTNLFGDILSDEAAQVVGGLGMAPSANIGDQFALFEPVHGAAFDIAGKQAANPSSFILSSKMMFEWLGTKHNDTKCFEIAKKIEGAVYGVVKEGIKTKDIGGSKTTKEFTQQVISKLT